MNISMPWYEPIIFKRVDVDSAIKIAGNFFNNLSLEKREKIDKFIDLLLEEWKISYGKPKSSLGTVLSGAKIEKLSEEERLAAIKNLKPWEATENWYDNPLKLFIHIWATDSGEIPNEIFFPSVARLLIMTDDLKRETDWPYIIKYGLWIADLQIDYQSDLIAHMKPAAEHEFNRRRQLRLKKQAQKEEKRNAVISAYIEISTSSEQITNQQVTIANKAGVSQGYASKILNEIGASTKLLKK